MSRIIGILVVLVAVIGGVFFFMMEKGGAESPVLVMSQPQSQAQEEIVVDDNLLADDSNFDSNVDIDISLAERAMGDPNAPITLIEYSSLTCPHCAHFDEEILPEIVENYVDTGKVYFIFRDFPIDNLALEAALMSRCFEGDRFFTVISVLFKNQAQWARADDPLLVLKNIGRVAGLSGDEFDACLADEASANAIMNRVSMADAYGDGAGVSATPTFYFNDGEEEIVGARDYAQFEEVFERLLEE